MMESCSSWEIDQLKRSGRIDIQSDGLGVRKQGGQKLIGFRMESWSLQKNSLVQTHVTWGAGHASVRKGQIMHVLIA